MENKNKEQLDMENKNMSEHVEKESTTDNRGDSEDHLKNNVDECKM